MTTVKYGAESRRLDLQEEFATQDEALRAGRAYLSLYPGEDVRLYRVHYPDGGRDYLGRITNEPEEAGIKMLLQGWTFTLWNDGNPANLLASRVYRTKRECDAARIDRVKSAKERGKPWKRGTPCRRFDARKKQTVQ